MSDYFDCIAFKKRPNSDKPIPVRLGSAKKRDDGGFQVYLDAVPAAIDGTYSFSIVPQRERADARPAGQKPKASGFGADLDDEIPFDRGD